MVVLTTTVAVVVLEVWSTFLPYPLAAMSKLRSVRAVTVDTMNSAGKTTEKWVVTPTLEPSEHSGEVEVEDTATSSISPMLRGPLEVPEVVTRSMERSSTQPWVPNAPTASLTQAELNMAITVARHTGQPKPVLVVVELLQLEET